MYNLVDPTELEDPLARYRPRVRMRAQRLPAQPRAPAYPGADPGAYSHFAAFGPGMMLSTTAGPAFTTRLDVEFLAELDDRFHAGPSTAPLHGSGSVATQSTLVNRRGAGYNYGYGPGPKRAKGADELASMVFSPRDTYQSMGDDDGGEEYEMSTAVGSGAPSVASGHAYPPR
jgi:hypothetical protein